MISTEVSVELFKKTVAESQHYSYSVMSDGSFAVYRDDHPESPRFFRSKDSICDCNDRIANLKQCSHQWCLNPVFIPEQWCLHYHNRKTLSLSRDKGSYINPVCKPTTVSSKLFLIDDQVGVEQVEKQAVNCLDFIIIHGRRFAALKGF